MESKPELKQGYSKAERNLAEEEKALPVPGSAHEKPRKVCKMSQLMLDLPFPKLTEMMKSQCSKQYDGPSIWIGNIKSEKAYRSTLYENLL